MDKEEHFKQLRGVRAKVEGLQQELQSIRDQEVELQARKSQKEEELKAARKERLAIMEKAIADNVAKAQVAREVGMDRTNLYKLLEGKDVNI